MMSTKSDIKVQTLGKYIVNNNATIRDAAKHYNLPKSTVFCYVTTRLHDCDYMLYKEVQKVLQHNKSVRHIRGGEATRCKWQAHKELNSISM